MSKEEYLRAAFEEGYLAFWDGLSDPQVWLPEDERQAWYDGWNLAHAEQSKEALKELRIKKGKIK